MVVVFFVSVCILFRATYNRVDKQHAQGGNTLARPMTIPYKETRAAVAVISNEVKGFDRTVQTCVHFTAILV